MLAAREAPGVALAAGLGLIAFASSTALGAGAWLSDIVIAIALGALVVNTPLRAKLRLAGSTQRDSDRFEAGLRFVGKWVLRAAIVLMGLKFQLRVFRPEHLGVCAAVLAFSLPTAWLVAQVVAARLALRRELGDLISIGTMICGSSAINALAPIVNARRGDQALAITSVFLFSVTALLVYHPVGRALGLPDATAGLWAGLSVNDLSGAVAVGTQFSSDAGLIATASKSLRISLLGPVLLGFTLLLRARGAARSTGRASVLEHLPRFVLGYLALCAARYLGDGWFAGAPAWAALLQVNDVVVKLLMLAVGAGIGLAIDARTLVKVGWRAAAAGAAASATVACVTLAMLRPLTAGDTLTAIVIGAAALAVAGLLFAVSSKLEPEGRRLEKRLSDGDQLSMREAAELLERRAAEGPLPPELCKQVVRQLHPALGELQPLRDAPVARPYNYRRLCYWRNSRGPGELVAMLWLPGTGTHIHSHDCVAVGKCLEGEIEVLDFARAERCVTLVARSRLKPGTLLEIDDPKAPHLVRNVLDRDALDVHLYFGPQVATAERFDPPAPFEANALAIGGELEVVSTHDEHPPAMMAPKLAAG